MAEPPSRPAPSHSHKYSNCLAAEHSPYVLQHTYNHFHLHIYLLLLSTLISFGIYIMGKEKNFTLIEPNDGFFFGLLEVGFP
jgi:hypothetical protein